MGVQRWPPHHTSPSQTQHSGGNQHDLPAKLFPSWHYTPSGTGDCRVWTGQDCHKTTNTSASLSDTAIMVLQLEQIPEGAVAINDGEENREASETGSQYLRELHTITFI